MKKLVFDIALMSSLIYRWESLIRGKHETYAKNIKLVFETIAWCKEIYVLYLESDYPPLKDLDEFNFTYIVAREIGLRGWSFGFSNTASTVRGNNTVTGKLVQDFLNNNVKPLAEMALDGCR